MVKEISVTISGYKVGMIDVSVSGKIMLLDNGTHAMTVPLRLLDDLIAEMKLAKQDADDINAYIEEGIEL